MKYLRQSTAATVPIGPFVAKADGCTPITNLTTGSTLNGRAVSNGAGAAYAPATLTHDANGHYLAALAVGDVPSVGRFRLEFSDPTTYLPVWEDFTVLSPAVYDSLFGTVALSTFAGGAVASVTAGVTVATNNDKTGYALTQTFPANFAALGITAGGHVGNVDTLTTYTGNTPQSGDAFARIGATGSGLTSLAPAATALSTAAWPTGLAASLATLASHDPGTTIGTSTYAGGPVASVTGNVGGSVASVTAAVNLPAIPTHWITSAAIADGALDGKGDWITTASLPTVDSEGRVTVAPGGLASITVEPGITVCQAISMIAAEAFGNFVGALGSTSAFSALGNPAVRRATVTITPDGRTVVLTLPD